MIEECVWSSLEDLDKQTAWTMSRMIYAISADLATRHCFLRGLVVHLFVRAHCRPDS
jgi:hypothetical protein